MNFWMRQEIDCMFITANLREQFIGTKGGIGDFPNAWKTSDHAPVTIDFAI